MSFSVFSDELSRAYNGETIDPEPINGFEIAKREIDARQSKQYEEAAAWYEKEFGDAAGIDSKPLPDVNEEKEEHFTIEHHLLDIDKEEISSFCKRTGTKESSLFSAVFGYTLSRFTGDNKVLYSTVYHGRSEKLTRRSFCMMVKTLPVYHDFTKTPTVIGLLQQTRDQMTGNRSHLSFSYGDLHDKLGVNCDVSFAYHGAITASDITINGRIQKKKNLVSHTPGFKLLVQVITSDKGYEISFDYDTNLYSEEFIHTLCNCYNKVLKEMLTKENLCDISLCDELQLKKLEAFNRTECDYDNTQTIPSLFRKAAAMYPDNECVVYDGRIYTYKEVDEWSDRIAWMIHEKGIGREQVVSVLIPRCEYMAIASLGILKAGAAYQPLDPTYPEERLNFMMKDADARLLICDRYLRSKVNEYEGGVVYIDELVSLPETGTAQRQELLEVSPHPRDLFILLYTSGSTGTPKGCMLEHGNLTCFCHWYQRYYSLKPEHKVAAYASYGFDANMMDMYPAITCGASTHIIPEEIRLDIIALNEYFEREGITHSFMTTQICRMFATSVDNHSLLHLSAGGETLVPCNPPKGFTLHNGYGPTECTIFSTTFPVDRLYKNVPIGRPVDNMKAYVIDKQKHLLPIGVPGELCLAGPQVSRGYLNRPEQTAKAYEANPFSSENGYDRIYHTGDIVRWLPDGNIEFVGRKDAQVKIRGFRIELTEVEGVIREYPQIKDATVQAFDEPNGNGKFICAYIVSDEKVDIQSLNAFIEERKPPYMVPAVTMQIDRIPLNQNQKVNRKALPKPERQAETYVMPQTDMQQQLYDIVAEIIGNKDFGITNNLFYYGLTSITAIKLAVRINNVLGIAVQNRQLKENNTIKKLAALLEAQSGVETVKFETLADYPLTQSQTGIYVECSANEGTTIYNIPYLLQLSPEVDICKLEKALRQAVENHKEIKRHLTVNADGEVRQKPMPDADIEITRSKTDEATLLADTSQLVKPYQLLDSHLYRFEIIETESRPYLYLDFHHIISDGTSMNILVEDINHIYNGEPVEEEEIDAFECAQLEEYERTTEAYTKAKSYYDSLFGDVEDIAGFATDDLAVAPEEKIAWNTLHDDRQSTSAIRDYCRKNGVTENAFFNAVFGFVLAKYNNASEAVFATIYNGRNDSRKVRTMDMMVKTMPCRFRMSDGAAVIDIIRSQASQIEDLMANDLFSFAEANHEYGVTADTLLAYQGDSFGVNELAGHPATAIPVSLNTAKADITLQIFINDGCLEYKAEYNPRKYSADTIENILSSISESARQFAVCKNINDVTMLDKRHVAVLDEFNHTECEYDSTQTISSLFRKAAALYPDNDCVVYDGSIYTYKEVDAISDNIAWMIHEKGIGREQVVSVLIPRCEYMAIASLGILKAGAAYQPLDPTYPEERLNFMMKDADARLLICDRSLRAKVNEYEGDVVYIDELVSLPETDAAQRQELLAISPNPQALFILLYTSGSTGTPKGCQIEQRNIVAFCHWYQREYQLTSESRASAYASYGFDANMMDTWPALTIGASVHIISEDLRMNLVALNDYFEHNGITHCLMTTQIGRQFATEIDNHSLHHLNVGGEKLVPCNPPQNFTLHNAYGPTEGTIVATSFVVDRLYANVPIGRPVDNMKAYIIDKQKHLLPVGAAGELCISGPQISRGYLNRPEQTALAYEPNPFSNEEGYERIYHTGDIVRWLPDGNIEFVGRKDAQVKIRGFRIELTEVEGVIREYPQIKDATVQAFDAPGGGKFICAYIVSDEKIDIQRLNAFIEERKPPYMVPAVTMQIDKIPLNQNQKVNKKALPKPERQSLADENADDAPRQLNLLEQKLVEMIGHIIGNPPAVSAPLTYCGLSSILAIRLAAQLFKSFGINLTGRELLGSATVLSIENLILEKMLSGEPTQSEASAPAASADKPTESPLTFAQQGVYFDCVRNPEATTYNIPVCFTFDKTVDARSLAQAVQAVADAHPVLRSRFEMRGNEVIQVITDATVQVEQLTLDDEQAEERKRGFIRPFDLEQAPLCHLAVADTPSSTLLLADFHHLVFDGTSLSVFIRQIADALGGMAPLKENYCYTEYALEQAAFAKSDAFAANKTYYDEMLREMEHAAEIPANLHGNEAEGRLRLTDAPLAFEQVEHYAKEHGVTAASVMLAAAFYTTARFINADKVYLATVSSGRQDVRLCDTFGMFVNTLPLAVAIGKQTADEFIQECCEVLQATVDHEAYPFARIAADYGFSPSVVFTYQVGVVADTIPGLKHYAPLAYDEAKFKVEICVQERDGVSKVTVIYNDALYSESLMSTLAQSVAAAAMHLIGSAGQPLRSISLLGEQQRKALSDIHYTCIDASAVRFPLFHCCIEHYAVHTPDTVALVANNETLTYSMLNAKANVLAHALMSRGVNMGDRICLLLPRCSWHIIAMFGVMKAGAAYIPCDPEYPAERIKLITEDSHARYIITTADKMANYGDRALDVETLLKESGEAEMQNPALEQSSDSLAYLIYTSGSTGRPKGVMLRHQGICNYLTPHPANLHIYAMAQRCRVMLNITTVSFDLSLKEIGASLYNGMTLVMADEEQVNNPQALAQLMLSTHVDGFSGTPSRLKMFLDLPLFQEALSQCRYVILGGEKYPPTLLPIIKRLAPEAQLFNTYGPTEISVSCNGKDLTHADRITIGRPLLNVEEYVVDNDLNELPIGVTGELLIGGMGVAVGYNDLPEKTDEAFIMYKGTRCYKSGDYAYWNEDGEISILGRKDHQIKLNGLRIELGEVETVLNRQPQVKEGVVMIKNVEGRDHLVAYYTLNDAVDIDTLKKQMGKSLTHYMIPTIFMHIDSMPVSPNGKTDLKALPQPELNTHEYVAPQNEAESFFCNTFAEILNLPRVGVTDHFFELGGTSLVAIRVVMSAMHQGYKIVYKQVFEHPTPRELADLVFKSEATNNPAVETTVDVSAVVRDEEADNYDYTAINRLLQGNSLASLGTEPLRPLHTCIVTGATGFLGIHVVRELIGHPEVKSIYCLVRSNRMQQAEERLRTQLFYYFGDTFDSLFGTRLIVVDGDITQTDSLDSIPQTEDPLTLFNCAANVKHFSAGTDIEDINIGGCQTCIDFCLKRGARLMHTSTHSIAGTKESDGPCEPDVLNEQRLYWGQSLANQYAHAKFIAERNVLEAIVSHGLDAKIMRLGNLSARSSDGEFQINFKSNTFMGRLKAYQTIGCIPYQMALRSIEFSPIEEVARAIVILSATPRACTVYHPVNAHRELFDDIVVCLERLGIHIQTVEQDEYQRRLADAFNNPAQAPILQSLMAYQSEAGKVVVSNVDDYSYTTQTLLRMGFRWNFTSWDYIEQFITAIAGLGFFDEDYQR